MSERIGETAPGELSSSSASSRSRSLGIRVAAGVLGTVPADSFGQHGAANLDPGLEVGVSLGRSNDDHPDRFSFPCFFA